MLEKAKEILMKSQQNEGVKVSLYLPTSRLAPDFLQDAIVYKNMVQEAKAMLEAKYNRRVWLPIITQLEELQRNTDFWNHAEDGLAVFADGQLFEYVLVPQAFEQKLVIQDQFYLVPLLTVTVVEGDYLVDLSKDRLTIFELEGVRAKVLEQEQIKTSFPELFDDFDANSNVNFAGYMGGSQTAYHGHRARPEEQEKDRDKYFRYVDQQLAKLVAAHEPHVILSGTADTIAQFRNLAKGRFYFDEVIDKPFCALDHREQEKQIRDILSPYAKAKAAAEIKDYDFQKSRDKVELDPGKILEFSEQGRVARIILSGSYAAEAGEEMNRIVAKAVLSDATVHTVADGEFKDKLAAVLRY